MRALGCCALAFAAILNSGCTSASPQHDQAASSAQREVYGESRWKDRQQLNATASDTNARAIYSLSDPYITAPQEPTSAAIGQTESLASQAEATPDVRKPAQDEIGELKRQSAFDSRMIVSAYNILRSMNLATRADIYCTFTANEVAILMRTEFDQDVRRRCLGDLASGRNQLPTDTYFREKIAKALSDLEDVDRKILKTEPGNTEITQELNETLRIQGKQPENRGMPLSIQSDANAELASAEKTYRKVLANDPTNADVIKELASVLRLQGKINESNAVLETLPK